MYMYVYVHVLRRRHEHGAASGLDVILVDLLECLRPDWSAIMQHLATLPPCT